MSLTDKLVDLGQTPSVDLPPRAAALARFSLLDWVVCGRKGIDEPLAGKLRKLAKREGGTPSASTFGGDRAPARMAALVNGATSHVLDFDDTHFAHIGHLSVGIFPAALAVAEERGKSATEVIEAFLVGAEAAIRLGVALGSDHYNRGFHQTATAGAFGATVAAGRLYDLSATEMTHALGLCATRASGLKSQFGTMGKPYNAGIAASNGVEVAQLASMGFTSVQDGVSGPQGFILTHSIETDPEARWETPEQGRFLFEDNKYKLHACCHGTHAMIEALLAAKVDVDQVEAFALRTSPRWLNVCNQKSPASGLAVKFSYAWLAGMALRGDATGDDNLYSDALVADPFLQSFANRVTVEGDANVTDLQAVGVLTLKSGETVEVSYDLAASLPEDVLRQKLTAKAVAALGEEGQKIWECHDKLDGFSARDLGMLLTV